MVATDAKEILNYCADNGFPALTTSSQHNSGTDRLVEVMEQDGTSGALADIYVNIQGDEPMVTAAHIELLLAPFGVQAAQAESRDARDWEPHMRENASPASSRGIQVSTLKVAISSEVAADPNAVKVVTDSRGLALYFSRSPIPYDRSGNARHYKHLGFYAYTAEALRNFKRFGPSPLEHSERLEQLRFLENGIPMAVIETDQDTIGVDTEEDLKRVEDYFRQTMPNADTGLPR